MTYPNALIIAVQTANDTPRYKLLRTFMSAPEHGAIEVASGFIYDGASTPRWTWSLFGMLPDGENREAALIHDWIYVHQGRINEKTYSRRECDRLFLKMLKDYGVTAWKARVAFLAVRLGGGKYWNN